MNPDLIVERYQRLRDQRKVWETHWQELADLMLPKRADFTAQRTKGAQRNKIIFDGTAMQDAIRLASSLDAMIKPRQSRWVTIRARDEELNNRDDVKAWLEICNDILWRHIYRPKARFQQASAECDLDLTVLGTGVLMTRESHDKAGVSYFALPLRDVVIAENHDGVIDTAFIIRTMTARQAEQQFGRENLGECASRALKDDKPDEEIAILNAIMPRKEYKEGPGVKAKEKKFASVWIELGGGGLVYGGKAQNPKLLLESGVDGFPLTVPRWDTAAGEVYGRGPGMIALPDAKTLNQMSKTILEAGHKAVDPPLLMPDDSVIGAPNTYPGGITYYDANLMVQSGRNPVFPLVSGTNIPLGLEMENQRRMAIQRAFFRDVMNLPLDNPQMTATEVAERKAEFVRIVGPAFGRLESDYLAPVTERTFEILLAQGRFPTPPRVLQGREIAFDFASPVVKAQKSAEAASGLASIERLAPLLQINPDMADLFDFDQIVRDVGAANMPGRWLLGNARVEQIRQAKEQMREQQMMMQQIAEGAAAAKDGAQAVSAIQ